MASDSRYMVRNTPAMMHIMMTLVISYTFRDAHGARDARFTARRFKALDMH